MKPNEIFIIGGGRSILDGMPELKDKLQGKLTIALNKSIEKFPDSTFLCFVDKESFYKKYKEMIAKYQLVIGRYSEDMPKHKLPNTVCLSAADMYNRTLDNGVYSPFLVGLFALSLAIYLIDEGTIYLLGFDGGQLPPKPEDKFINIIMNKQNINVPVEDVTGKVIDEKSANNVIHKDGKLYRVLSHFYQGEIEHRGVGKIEFYTKNDKVNKLFEPFKQEMKCKIWNVSALSNLNAFSKINYSEMFKQINQEIYTQKDLRLWTIKRIGELKCVR